MFRSGQSQSFAPPPPWNQPFHPLGGFFGRWASPGFNGDDRSAIRKVVPEGVTCLVSD
jgi:hypothetical protein